MQPLVCQGEVFSLRQTVLSKEEGNAQMTRIAGVASAFPRHYYRQDEVANALKGHWGNELGNPEVLDRLLTRVGVEGRHLALPIEAYDELTTWGKSCRRRLISATPSTEGKRPVREERQNHLGLATTPAYRGSHGLHPSCLMDAGL